MKNILAVIIISILIVGCKNDKLKEGDKKHEHIKSATEKIDEPKKKPLSPHTETMAMIGEAHIHIDYSSPGVRGRIIFGGLVGYNNVWQSGAHKATWIETNKDLTINGEVLPKGKYGFFTIPSKGDWTVMFNKKWEQHGKDEYDEKDDVIRFKVTPQVSEEITEHLASKVHKLNDSEGTISLAWEKINLSFNFKIKN